MFEVAFKSGEVQFAKKERLKLQLTKSCSTISTINISKSNQVIKLKRSPEGSGPGLIGRIPRCRHYLWNLDS